MLIQVTVVGADRVAQKLRDMPAEIRSKLFKAVQAQWLGLQAHVVRDKLSGQVLKRVTGNLASSINAGGVDSLSEMKQSPDEITGIVGTKVRYAAIHEYGGTVTIPTQRRTSKLGKSYTVRAHKATFPERSFLRSSIRDRATQIRDAIQSSVQAAVRAATAEVNNG